VFTGLDRFGLRRQGFERRRTNRLPLHEAEPALSDAAVLNLNAAASPPLALSGKTATGELPRRVLEAASPAVAIVAKRDAETSRAIRIGRRTDNPVL